MKKNDLLKTIGICFLIFVLISWIFPIGTFSNGEYLSEGFNSVGLTDLLYYPIITFGTFIQYGILFLVIGGFYGVANETGTYKKLVNSITNKFKKRKKLFLVLTIILLSILSALTTLPLPLFVVTPLLVAVIMSLGYGRLTAFASTIGSILVGSIGSIYGINNGHINTILSLGIHDNIIPKVVLFVVLVFLLIMFVLRKSNLKEEKNTEIPLLDNTKETKKSTLPLIIVLSFTLILLLVSMYSWEYNLGITYFSDVYESLTEITINNYPIFQNLIGDISPFGYWDTYEMCFVLLASSLLIGWIYSIKFKDIIKSFSEGSKKMLKVAFYAMFANIIFTLMIAASNSNVLNTINHHLLNITEGFNIGVTTLISLVGSFFYNNFYYLANTTLTAVTSVYTDTLMYGVLGIIFKSMYSLMMLILPTSFVLIAGLSMLDISFKEWFKYIWKYLIQAFIIILIVSIIIFMII